MSSTSHPELVANNLNKLFLFLNLPPLLWVLIQTISAVSHSYKGTTSSNRKVMLTFICPSLWVVLQYHLQATIRGTEPQTLGHKPLTSWVRRGSTLRFMDWIAKTTTFCGCCLLLWFYAGWVLGTRNNWAGSSTGWSARANSKETCKARTWAKVFFHTSKYKEFRGGLCLCALHRKKHASF